MNIKRLLFATGLLAAVVASAQEPSSQKSKSDSAGDQAAAEHSNELDIRYARLMLQMSQLELQRIAQINKQIPGTFTKTSVEALEQSVMINEEQLKALTQQGGKRVPLFMISAEANAKATQQSLRRVLSINQQNPGTITANEVERLRLTAELAAVALEKARSIQPQNEAQFLQWQIDQLRSDFYQLHNRVAQLSRLN